MRPSLAIAVAQPACVAHDVAANAATHATLVRRAGTRVVVFPELSLTGYELDAEPVAPDDARLAPVVEACRASDAIALVGAPVPGADGRIHIASLAIDGAGSRVAYRKLWVDETEARFAPGDAPAVLTVDGWRLGLAICKDTGIARHQADTAALGIDAYVAGTLMSEAESAIQDERGRRIATDHRVWVAFASFAGSTGGGYDRALGRSSIWAPDGTLVARAGPETGAFARATLG